jgi:hypothetical protein
MVPTIAVLARFPIECVWNKPRIFQGFRPRR